MTEVFLYRRIISGFDATRADDSPFNLDSEAARRTRPQAEKVISYFRILLQGHDAECCGGGLSG